MHLDQWSSTCRSRSTGRSRRLHCRSPNSLDSQAAVALQMCCLSAAGGGAAGLSTAFPSIQVGLCTKLNIRTVRYASSCLSITIKVPLNKCMIQK